MTERTQAVGGEGRPGAIQESLTTVMALREDTQSSREVSAKPDVTLSWISLSRRDACVQFPKPGSPPRSVLPGRLFPPPERLS